MEAAWGCAAIAIVPGHWPEANDTAPWYGSRISLADQGVFGVAGEPGAFVEPS